MDKYLDQLDGGIGKLADKPELGRSVMMCAMGAACCLYEVTLSIIVRRLMLCTAPEFCTGASIRTGIWNREIPAVVRSPGLSLAPYDGSSSGAS